MKAQSLYELSKTRQTPRLSRPWRGGAFGRRRRARPCPAPRVPTLPCAAGASGPLARTSRAPRSRTATSTRVATFCEKEGRKERKKRRKKKEEKVVRTFHSSLRLRFKTLLKEGATLSWEGAVRVVCGSGGASESARAARSKGGVSPSASPHHLDGRKPRFDTDIWCFEISKGGSTRCESECDISSLVSRPFQALERRRAPLEHHARGRRFIRVPRLGLSLSTRLSIRKRHTASNSRSFKSFLKTRREERPRSFKPFSQVESLTLYRAQQTRKRDAASS